MSDLSAGQQIGGVYVVIGATTDKLRAGVAEAKQIAVSAERALAIRVPVIADTTQLKAELPRVVAAANVAVRMLPIRIPVMLDTTALAGQMAQVRAAMGGGGGFIGGGGGGMLALPAPSGGGGGQGPRIVSPGGATINIPNLQAGSGGAGGGAGNVASSAETGGVAEAAGAGAAGAGLRGSIRATLIGAAIVRAAGAAIQTGFDVRSQRAAYGRGDIGGELRAEQSREQTLKSLGLFGSGELGVGIRDSLSGSFTARGNDRAYIEDITAQTDIQEQKNARLAAKATAGQQNMIAVQAATRRIGYENQTRLALPEQAPVIAARQDLGEFNVDQERVRGATGKPDTEEVVQQRALLEKRVTDTVRDAGTERAQITSKYEGEVSQIIATNAQIRLAAAGQDYAVDLTALKQSLNERKRALADAQRDEAALKEKGADATDAAQRTTLARGDVLNAQAAIKGYGEARSRETGIAIDVSHADFQASLLRVGHKADEAARLEFDAQAKATLDRYGDPATFDKEQQDKFQAEKDRLSAKRVELVTRQNEATTNRQAGYSTRTAQAQAFDKYGVYQPGVAGIIGTISQDKAELRNAPDQDKAQITATQIAELKGTEKRIVNSASGLYAQSYDPAHDATPAVDNEQTNILKQIRDYLQVLSGGGNGATRAIP